MTAQQNISEAVQKFTFKRKSVKISTTFCFNAFPPFLWHFWYIFMRRNFDPEKSAYAKQINFRKSASRAGLPASY